MILIFTTTTKIIKINLLLYYNKKLDVFKTFKWKLLKFFFY